MTTTFDNFVKTMRGNLIVLADDNKERWITYLTNAWLHGYDAARQYEREDSECDSDTFITLVDTRTNTSKTLSVTLDSITVVSTNEGVSITVNTQYTEYTMLIDTAHTEVYSKRKYYPHD